MDPMEPIEDAVQIEASAARLELPEVSVFACLFFTDFCVMHQFNL